MHTQSLNGWWDYRIGNGKYVSKKIPYSDLVVGKSECRLIFDRAEVSERSFLIFEGITYKAVATLNDVVLGEMLPYCRYNFEITDLVKENSNVLNVEIYDIDVTFGPSEGWENYSGIIRDVYIEYTDRNIISDNIWVTEFTDGYNKAVVTVDATVDARDENLEIKYILKDLDGNVVYSHQSSETKISFEYEKPKLWSPDSPYLYTLELELYNCAKLCFKTCEKVGFKELKTKGKRFYLNGKPLFLLGVCRHDLYGNSGHTLTEAEMMKDMKMIKDAGVNYVRLVHYPHNKRIVEIADELGMLVSEEPGLWWSDMKNPEICEKSLEVLKKTIQRDRNHVSIAFWLGFNECIFTPEFLLNSARVCRENDVSHMVSGANCMDIEMTKKHFSECNLDFYTMHPYAATTARMLKSAEELNDKPLLLTEWGGYFVYKNENSLRDFIRTIIKCWKNDESDCVIAGAAIWCWAEMYEFHRGGLACHDGILNEGLVDIFRNPTLNLKIFKEEFARLNESEQTEYKSEMISCVLDDGDFIPVDLSNVISETDRADLWNRMISNAQKPIERFYYKFKRERRLEKGPILPEKIKNIGSINVELQRQPLIIEKNMLLTVPVGKKASEIYFFGNVSMPKGFPIGGKYGERVAEYTVVYTDNSKMTYSLFNGTDITTAAAYYGPSRINPVAENAKRVIKYSYDFDFEHYVVNMQRLPVDSDRKIEKIIIDVVEDDYYLLLYGITLKA